MKKFNLLNILDRKFRSPDEPELDWYLGYKDSDELLLANDGLGILHLKYWLGDNEEELSLVLRFDWPEEEDGISTEASQAFRAAADYIEDLDTFGLPIAFKPTKVEG